VVLQIIYSFHFYWVFFSWGVREGLAGVRSGPSKRCWFSLIVQKRNVQSKKFLIQPEKCLVVLVPPVTQKYLRLRNDLYCVGWGVKLYSLNTLTPRSMITARKILMAAHSQLIIVCKLPCYKCSAVRIQGQKLKKKFLLHFYPMRPIKSKKTQKAISWTCVTESK